MAFYLLSYGHAVEGVLSALARGGELVLFEVLVDPGSAVFDDLQVGVELAEGNLETVLVFVGLLVQGPSV